MPEIKKSAGNLGDNDSSDAALIQAMFVVVTNAKGIPYLDSYDGVVGKNTKAAIMQFQQDHISSNKRAGWMAVRGNESRCCCSSWTARCCH